MNRADVFKKITINDYWVSILENWADAVKEYKRECESKKVVITVCLPKISKYFWRMLDAMFAAYNKLTPTLQSGIIIEFCIFYYHTIPYHATPRHTTPTNNIVYTRSLGGRQRRKHWTEKHYVPLVY